MLEELAATPVREIHMREPARAAPDTALGDVVAAMRAMRRGACLVEDGGRVVGIVTERDLMTRIDHGDAGWPASWRERPVAEVMTREPTQIRASESLASALRCMQKGPFRHLPVVDDQGAPMGVLSIRDLLAHVAEQFPAELINLPPDPEHEASAPWGG